MNIFKKLTLLALGCLAFVALPDSAMAQGTVDADAQTLVDNLTATFGIIKTFVLAVLTFGLVIWLVSKVRKAR